MGGDAWTGALPLATAPSTCPVRAGPAPCTRAGAHPFPPAPTRGRWRWGAQCGPPQARRPPPAAQGRTLFPTWRHRRPELQQQEQHREVADPAAPEPQAGHGLTLRRALAGYLSGPHRLGRPAACECRCRAVWEEVRLPGRAVPRVAFAFAFALAPGVLGRGEKQRQIRDSIPTPSSRTSPGSHGDPRAAAPVPAVPPGAQRGDPDRQLRRNGSLPLFSLRIS